MTIIEVTDKKSRNDFLNVARVIYKNDPFWICPLDETIETIFDPEKNNFFKHGQCIRWIIKNEDGKLLGRVAAFINEKKAYTGEQPTGGMGFFESINDQEVAFALFDQAKKWLQQRGMQAMDGPINFGENDSFWGLLIEGFVQPSFGMNYNHEYYRTLFENYGFKIAYEQITNHLDIEKPFPERFTKIANWVIQKPGYTFKSFDQTNINAFADAFVEVYNDGWRDFTGFAPIGKKTILESFEKMKVIMDPKLVWVAYVNDEPASFIVILPDANLMIKGLNGKLNLIGKLRFLYRKLVGVNRMRAIVMGTKHKFQKHGLESSMFIKLKEYVIPKHQYKELELSWVGDFNKKMLTLHDSMGVHFGKRHATMRCIF